MNPHLFKFEWLDKEGKVVITANLRDAHAYMRENKVRLRRGRRVVEAKEA